MTNFRGNRLKQPLLLWGVLFLAHAQADPGSESKPRRERPIPSGCSTELPLRQAFDLGEGLEERLALDQLNRSLEQRIAAGTLTWAHVLAEGLAEFSEEPATDNAGQKIPYLILRFPRAHTGVLIPVKKGELYDRSLFDAIAIALPGIGFSVSVAKSMVEISGTLTKGENIGLQIRPGRPLRVLSLPMDAPLNGMAENAPFSFGHPTLGILPVLRHVRLLLGVLFPDKKFIMLGRSQGGANVLEYAAYYDDLAAVVAMNPSSSKREIIEYGIHTHENMLLPENREQAKKDGFDIVFHVKSWSAHDVYTHLYTYAQRPSKVPAQILLATDDKSYPRELYLAFWEAWRSEQPGLRQIDSYIGKHNGWMRIKGAGEKNFENVIRLSRDFLVPRLAIER